MAAPGSGGGAGAEPVAHGVGGAPFTTVSGGDECGVSRSWQAGCWEQVGVSGKGEEGRGTWDRKQRALRPQGYSQIPQELGVRALGSHRRLLPGVEEERPEARGRSWGQVWVDPNHGQWCLKPLVSQGSSGLCPLPGPGRQLLAGAPVPCRELEGASRGPHPCPLGLTLREKGQRNCP